MSPLFFFFFFFFLLLITPSSSTPPQFPCSQPHHTTLYPFCNTTLPTSTRAHSLISHLTLPEKIQQLSNSAAAIPRLQIPAYQWWSESLHGIAANGPGVSFKPPIPCATSFPQIISTSAAFNRTLWRLVGEAVAVEGRAMYNNGQAGLTFWAPNVNVFRDPRWGRGQETPGEDPMVVSAYAVEFVKGFQGGDGRSEGIMLSACCKHFTAYDLEMWGEFSRYSFNAVVSEQDLEDTYQPPFRSCIQEGKASCLMCSYNAVNGIPACADKSLLDKARVEWGFKGYITSDCDAVATVFEYQNYTETIEDAVADVIQAGTDIDCGTYLALNTLSTIEQGKVQEEDIDRALFNLFSVQLRLGLFDGDPIKGRYGKLGVEDVCTPAHKKLALEAARQGIVLLKNDNKFLPLRKGVDFSLAVIGPLANNASLQGGGYTGIPCDPKTPFDGLQEYIKRTSYTEGCLDVPCESDDGFKQAIHAAEEADFSVIVVGLDPTQEREDHDRVSLLLPSKQMALVSSVAAASKNPVILVLIGGGPLDVSFAENDPRIASILYIGYPGETGGTALSEIIFGDVNPSGRLTMTWYFESFTNVPMNDMNMRADPSRGYPGRTYRFFTGNKLYGFGHGLSYTNYTYSITSAPTKLSIQTAYKVDSIRNILHQPAGYVNEYIRLDEVSSCDSLRLFVEIDVMNAGDMDGSHTVLLFSRVSDIMKGAPKQQLVGFSQVHTTSNKSASTTIVVDPCTHLSFANDFGERILPLGDHVLMIGDVTHSLTVESN